MSKTQAPDPALRQLVGDLLAALDAHMFTNDYCGLEVGKRHAPVVSDAVEKVRAALAIPAPEGAQLPEPHGMKWRNKQTGATGVYFEDPRHFGINTEHPDYEWTPIYTADQFRTALAAPAPQAPAWQPIETAPKDGSRLILWWAGMTRVGRCAGVGVARDGGDWWQCPSLECAPTGRPTHWMPLPAAPQTKEPKA